MPSEIQRSTPSGGDFGESGSGPGGRSDALSGMKNEKAASVTAQGLEENAAKTQEGGAAIAAEDLKAKGEKTHKDISAQSSHKGVKKGMKKELPENELQQADPLEKE